MAIEPRRILWPTDFSKLSLLGARYAAAYRKLFGAQLHVIHVVLPPYTAEVGVMAPAELPIAVANAELIQECRDQLAQLVREQFDNPGQIVTDAFYGNPWSSICDYAGRNQIELIIIPTHGRTGLKHALIGSTAERVVRHAACPVLVVKSSE